MSNDASVPPWPGPLLAVLPLAPASPWEDVDEASDVVVVRLAALLGTSSSTSESESTTALRLGDSGGGCTCPWCFFMCMVRLRLRINALVQNWHLWGRSLECTAARWYRSPDLSENLRSHPGSVHANGFLPVCTALCTFSCALPANALPQPSTGHLNGFSPV